MTPSRGVRAEYWHDLNRKVEDLDQYYPPQEDYAPREDSVEVNNDYYNDISLAYDATAEEYTLTFTNIQTFVQGIYTAQPYWDYTQVLKFDKPPGIANPRFYINTDPLQSGRRAAIRWIGYGAISSDAATQALELTSSSGYAEIARISTMSSPGTSDWILRKEEITTLTGAIKKANPLIVGFTGSTNPSVDTTARTIDANDLSSPNGTSFTKTLSYSEPVNDTLILGWNEGSDNVFFDFYANRATYDDYVSVGVVEIDASNTVVKCYGFPGALYGSPRQPFGKTENVTEGGTTFIFKRGIFVGTL